MAFGNDQFLYKNVAERCKPYRISLSIMDRWEIGGNVISELLIPIIKSVKSCETTYEESQYAEILRSASAFLTVLKPLQFGPSV